MSLNEWPSKKINWLFNKIGSGSTPNSSNEAYYNSDDIPWLLTGDLNDNYISKPSKYISNKAYQENTALIKFPRNSLVMAMYGATIGKLGITTYETTTNQACCVFGEPKEIEVKYTFYWLMANRKEIINLSHGGGQPNISQGIIKNIRISVPPIDDQKKIVRFIDIKYNEINKIIDTKLKLIELLEQQRQSIITEAVTKGLNPNVKMKDSGVEWIGEIPENWSVKKVKYLISEPLSYGANESAELDDRELPRYIRITDIDDSGKLRESTFKSISKEIANLYNVKNGDILLARSGATVGKSYFHRESESASHAGYLIKLRAKNYKIGEYIYLYTQSTIYFQWINSNLIQATIQNVSAEKYANLYVSIPDRIEEVELIVNNIKHRSDEINSLIQKIKIEINLIKEYRQCLIYEAVTGKIDVSEMELEEVR